MNDKSQNTQEFKNENIEVALTRSPQCKVKLEIAVTPKAAKNAYSKAIKSINKEVSLPGFRKGRAPETVVVQNYGKHVDREWREELVQASFREALKLTGVYPMNEKSVQRPELKKASLEDGALVAIQFESHPEIPEIKPEDFSLEPVERKEVNEKDVENTLEQIRLHHASWEDITDRPVQEGDFVDVDIINVDEEKPIVQDSRFEVKEGKMGDWMMKMVLGLKTGESDEGVSERSAEVKEEDFIPTKCRITINKIVKPKLPELNDELAKKTGVDSVEELKKRVEQDLNRQADAAVKEKKRQQVEDQLMEKYPFEIPASLTAAEKDSYLRQYDSSKESESEIEERVNRALRMFFLARKITSDNKLSISEQELLQEVMQEIYTRPKGADTNVEELRSKAYIRILSNKAKDFLLEQVEEKEKSK